jgi:hypothetical protein
MLDFGEIPTSLSPAAEIMLARLPQKALGRLSHKLRAWADKAPISAAKASYYIDYDDPDLRYVLLQFRLKPMEAMDVDDEAELELQLTADLTSTYAEALEAEGERDRRRLAAGLTVSVAWPDDWDYTWGDTSAADA